MPIGGVLPWRARWPEDSRSWIFANPSAGLPGVGPGGQLADVRRHPAADQLGQAHLVDHLADRGAYGDPEVGQVLRRPRILGLLRAQAPDPREWTVHSPQNLTDRHVPGTL